MSFGGQQQLILVICRWNLNPFMIPPFKIIIPTLQLLGPFRIFSSMGKQITPSISTNPAVKSSSLYEILVQHLQNQQGKVDLNETMNIIYEQKHKQQKISNTSKNNETKNINHWNFRVCILGEQIISWDIVMKFKLKGIVIDTIGENKRLQQISFATGGINKSPAQNQNITKLFLTIFSLSTQCRKKYNFLSLCKDEQTSSQSIEFTVDCVCCKPKSKQLANQLYLCSRCLAVHCSKMSQNCAECGVVFQNIALTSKPC